MNTRQKEDYLFAKKNGICVNCKTECAEPGKTLCIECAEKIYAKNRNYMKSLSDEKKKMIYARNAERNRAIYTERKRKKLCVKCGKRCAIQGKTTCLECYVKRKRKKDKRYNNEIPRSERKHYGMCYVCAAQICEESDVLCKEHYMLYKNQMEKLNANPTEAMLEHRQYLRDLEHARIEKIKWRAKNEKLRKI